MTPKINVQLCKDSTSAVSVEAQYVQPSKLLADAFDVPIEADIPTEEFHLLTHVRFRRGTMPAQRMKMY